MVDVFHSFCRPTINPGLSDFCRALTGIEQRTVDAAEEFPRVHERFLHWLRAKHRLGVDRTFAVVTDGPFDMGRFLFQQTRHLGAPFPDYADHWVNLRKAFANFYKGDFYSNKSGGGGGGGGGGTGANGGVSKLPGLQAMLSSLGMEFEVSHACAYPDLSSSLKTLRMSLCRASLTLAWTTRGTSRGWSCGCCKTEDVSGSTRRSTTT